VLRRTNELKMLNPNFPFFIREGDSIDPVMIVDFDWGRQKVVDLSGMTEKQVDDSLKQVSTGFKSCVKGWFNAQQ
jgi:hypothetical protein